jgi:predicted ATP-dependent endonuclease of OLD family
LPALRSITAAQSRRLLQPLGQPFLVGLEIENLRGFRRARLDLSNDLIVLVGPNNSGKTSIFRMLDWLLNGADEATLAGDIPLTEHESQLLIPARNTRGGARRIVLRVWIRDGRRRARFFADDGFARLRFRVRGDRVYTNVRPPSRSELLDSEEDALELLRELRASTYYRHVPASRDVASQRFRDTLSTALEARLSERAVHQARAGAPGEYRDVRRALSTLKEIAERLAEPLWTEMSRELVPTLSRDASLRLAVEAPDLVRWMAEHIELKLITGDHDPGSVFPIEVGSGLQSLLDLAMFRGEAAPADRDAILAIEEPEAFLHPTAQRTLARRLAQDDGAKRLISTHSPIFVDESTFENIVLVRNHVIYQPSDGTQSDADRATVNTALLSGQGAEMAFSRGVLLVEGEADKLFFETLRRRFAVHDPTGALDELSIVWVGSNTLFAPWMRLLESYITDHLRAIEWLVVADGADSSAALARAFRESRVSLSPDVSAALQDVGTEAGTGDDDRTIRAIRRFNQAARRIGVRANLLPIDLEYAALHSAADATVIDIAVRLGLDCTTREELLRKLGSKHGAGPSNRSVKAPWARAILAESLPAEEISGDVREVLQRWFRMVLGDTRRANDVLRAGGISV